MVAIDPTFERQIQATIIVGQAANTLPAAGTTLDVVNMSGAIVPAGSFYLVERISLRLNLGAAPTGNERFTLYANQAAAAQEREGTEGPIPAGAFGPAFNGQWFADESSPVRFWPGETLFPRFSGMPDSVVNLVTCIFQVAITVPVVGAGVPADDIPTGEAPEGGANSKSDGGWN